MVRYNTVLFLLIVVDYGVQYISFLENWAV